MGGHHGHLPIGPGRTYLLESLVSEELRGPIADLLPLFTFVRWPAPVGLHAEPYQRRLEEHLDSKVAARAIRSRS